MTDILPFRLGIDHKRKCLRMIVEGRSGNKVSANMSLEQIREFMAILSQCEHALVLSKEGHEVNLPINPEIAFAPVAGKMHLGAYETVRKIALGADDINGAVSLTVLSHAGRLSGFRIAPDTARGLGQGLIDTANVLAVPTTKQ